MREYTNLAWPQQPFGAGQRPFAVPAPMLAAIAIQWIGDGERAVPVCTTTAYLRLHRTRALPMTEQSLSVGFRTSLVDAEYETETILDVIDADLSRCRRHAAIFAAHSLIVDLGALRALDPEHGLRGVAEIEGDWVDRVVRARDLAKMFDTSLDLFPGSGYVDLGTICRNNDVPFADLPVGARDRAGIAAARSAYLYDGDLVAGELTALANLQQAIAIALIAAAAFDRYDPHAEEGALISLDRLVFRLAWDCFPHLDLNDLSGADTFPATGATPP